MMECPECGCEKCTASVMQMVKGKPHLWYECPRCRLRFVKPYEKHEKNLTISEKNDRMSKKGNNGNGK